MLIVICPLYILVNTYDHDDQAEDIYSEYWCPLNDMEYVMDYIESLFTVREK